VSILCAAECSEVLPLAVRVYLGKEKSSPSWTGLYAQESGAAIRLCLPLILQILFSCDLAQIDPSIVRFIPIHVINFANGISASHVHPGEAMHFILLEI